MRRVKMSNRKKDSRMFKRTASGTKAVNVGAIQFRGGTRLWKFY